MKDPAVPLNFAIFLHNRKQPEEAKKMFHLFEIRVQKLRTTPGLDADPDVLQAASNLADKMEHTLSISVPKPATGSKQRRDLLPESAKSIRKSALKSARAAGKNKLIIFRIGTAHTLVFFTIMNTPKKGTFNFCF